MPITDHLTNLLGLGGASSGSSQPTVLTPQNVSLIVSATVATTLVVTAALKHTVYTPLPRRIPSPRDTLLPRLSKSEKDALPYPPDLFPGARDVENMYGKTRVYEWGPETGKKVLLIHGISTPCLSLGGVAHGLVSRGCRVILFDLWGRGYSDEVSLPHDTALYTTQILAAVTSSPLSWTGSGSQGGFAIVGYSLGGGISADFAAYMPGLVSDVVLLAPSGIIRPEHFSSITRMAYSGIIPDRLLFRLMRKRIAEGAAHNANKEKNIDAKDIVSEEIPAGEKQEGLVSKSNPDVTVRNAVRWQVQYHGGFIPSFVSSIRYASIEKSHENWKKLGSTKSGVGKDKVLIIAGSKDPLIIAKELKPDAEDAIGRDKVEFKTIEGAHEFPVTSAGEVVDVICEFWGI
ncbi:Alpha/Beta hydrolase protein [Xylogone sp. PMI_703]|nr:Alpha/Beta hydrolase protein [Xylogone sp. PMI_703]